MPTLQDEQLVNYGWQSVRERDSNREAEDNHGRVGWKVRQREDTPREGDRGEREVEGVGREGERKGEGGERKGEEKGEDGEKKGDKGRGRESEKRGREDLKDKVNERAARSPVRCLRESHGHQSAGVCRGTASRGMARLYTYTTLKC
eukprot:2593957-Rhodomonas_salina.2